jgi:hypothetical protein
MFSIAVRISAALDNTHSGFYRFGMMTQGNTSNLPSSQHHIA